MKRKIFVLVNTSWNIFNFRKNLVGVLIEAGFEVVAVAPRDAYSAKLPLLGCRYVEVPMENKGTNIWRDLIFAIRLTQLFEKERPDLILSYTVKPNIYGSLAARLNSVPIVNNISGLGAVFIRPSKLTVLVSLLYKLSLKWSRKTFFQNQDDLDLFTSKKLVNVGSTELIPGSGVDLNRFKFSELASCGRGFKFLLVARLLWDKGLAEYVGAAMRLKVEFPEVEWRIVGFLGVENPAAISAQDMDKWVSEGVITFSGPSDEIEKEIRKCDCLVLPSYREGLSRTLLEGAAIGRPLIATNVPGCKEVVVDGKNGYLVEPCSIDDLTEKMRLMYLLSREQRAAMAKYGRRKVEKEFSEEVVNNRYLEVVKEIIADDTL